MKVASRFAILADEDEELEFEAPPGLEMRKTAVPCAQKYSVYFVTQKTKIVKLEVIIESGAQDRGQRKRGRGSERPGSGPLRPHRGSFEVTDVTKPLVAVRRMIEEGNAVHFGAENFIRIAKSGKIPMRKKAGSYVIDIEVNVDVNEAELFSGRA